MKFHMFDVSHTCIRWCIVEIIEKTKSKVIGTSAEVSQDQFGSSYILNIELSEKLRNLASEDEKVMNLEGICNIFCI